MKSKKNNKAIRFEKLNYHFFVFFAVFVLLIPILTKNEYFLGIGIFTSIHTIIVLSLSLSTGYAGLVSIGHAAFFGLGAYISAIITVKLGVSAMTGLIAVFVFSGVIAVFIGFPTVKLKGYYIAMATLAMGAVFFALVKEWNSLTGGVDGIINIPRISFFNYILESDRAYYYFAWSICLLFLLMAYHLVNSRTGRALRAIAGSEDAAEALGINSHRYKLQIFILSVIFAGIAGWLYAHFITYISPTSFSPHFSIIILAIAVIASIRSIPSAITGGILLTILPEFLRAYEDFEIIIYGAFLMFSAMFFPDGITVEVEKLIRKLNKQYSNLKPA
jgi:branched-chain amino acid transport system permease protein